MITDANLELSKTWDKQVGKLVSGDDHPVIPDTYGFDASIANYMRFFAQGKAYATWMAFNKRPVLPNTGNLSLSFELMLDSTTAGAQALEFDLRLAIGGYDYNFSNQINQVESGQLQIASPDGKWLDTGLIIGNGKLAYNVPHQFRFNFVFDTKTKKKSTVSVVVDNRAYSIPTKLQNMSVGQFNWEDTCILQIQQDIGPISGYIQQVMRNINIGWY